MAMPGSYSCFIPLILNQMCIITVLGVVSTCLTVHLVGCARAGFAGEVPCVEGCWVPDLVLAQWLSPQAHRESWGGGIRIPFGAPELCDSILLHWQNCKWCLYSKSNTEA